METIELKPTGPSVNRHRSKQDFGTPWPFIRAVERRFGPIAWDLAAHAGNTKHANYFSIEQDSFKQDWHKIPGNLWLNPEFSDIDPWAAKCAAEMTLGAKALFLTPASIGANWFAKHVYQKALVIGLNGRLSFDGIAPYPKDCMLSCFGFGVGFEVWNWREQP